MSASPSNRLLSIGEFAAATQLSPKALRLYAEQRLLEPASVDPLSGYRHYRADQVARGRLIRTLRDMDMPLADVARVLAAEGARAEGLLTKYAREREARYAGERRAFHIALLLLRDVSRADAMTIETKTRPALTVVVRPFVTGRRRFYERLHSEIEMSEAMCKRSGLRMTASCGCALVEPISDEEGRVELLVPVETPSSLPDDITLRHVPPATCAIAAAAAQELQSGDFSAPLDAIFDWFDRHGHRATDVPWLAFAAREAVMAAELQWAFESSPRQR